MKAPLEKTHNSYPFEKLKKYGKYFALISALSGVYYWYASPPLSDTTPLLEKHERLINSCFQNKEAEKCKLLNDALMKLIRDNNQNLESVYSSIKDKVSFEELSEYCKDLEEFRQFWKNEKEKTMMPVLGVTKFLENK